MVLEMTGRGGWSGRAKLSRGQEPQNTGPRDCPAATKVSNSLGSQMGGQTAKQKGYSHDIFTKEKVAKCSSELKH